MPQHHGKRYKNLEANFDKKALYTPAEAIGFVKKNANAKFNETVEIHIRLGVDPKKSDQNVRGTVLLHRRRSGSDRQTQSGLHRV
jgi:large subunit ribosomal protein L1